MPHAFSGACLHSVYGSTCLRSLLLTTCARSTSAHACLSCDQSLEFLTDCQDGTDAARCCRAGRRGDDRARRPLADRAAGPGRGGDVSEADGPGPGQLLLQPVQWRRSCWRTRACGCAAWARATRCAWRPACACTVRRPRAAGAHAAPRACLEAAPSPGCQGGAPGPAPGPAPRGPRVHARSGPWPARDMRVPRAAHSSPETAAAAMGNYFLCLRLLCEEPCADEVRARRRQRPERGDHAGGGGPDLDDRQAAARGVRLPGRRRDQEAAGRRRERAARGPGVRRRARARAQRDPNARGREGARAQLGLIHQFSLWSWEAPCCAMRRKGWTGWQPPLCSRLVPVHG